MSNGTTTDMTALTATATRSGGPGGRAYTPKHPGNDKVELTGIQTCNILGVGRVTLGYMMEARILTPIRTAALALNLPNAGDNRKGLRYHFDFEEVMALKGKITKGEWSPLLLRRNGWKRPDISRKAKGAARLSLQVAALTQKVEALLSRLDTK